MGLGGTVTGAAVPQAAAEIQALYRLFVAVDATQVEINPLIETPQGHVVAVDAKIQVRAAARRRRPRTL